MNPIQPTPNNGHNRTSAAVAHCCRRSAFAAITLVLLAGILGAARAVDIRMALQPVWSTVSVNSSNVAKINIGFTITTNGLITLDGTGTNYLCDPINVSVTCPANPSGLSLAITDLSTNVITSFTPLVPTNGSITVTNLLWVKTTNVPPGTYGYQLDASGPGTGLLRLTLQSAYIWGGFGATNAANGGSLLWSEPTNWVGGNLPGDGAEVVLGDRGGVGSAVTNINMEISANVTIGSLRDTITGNSTLRYNILLDPGVTLRVTNENSLSLGLRDRSDTTREWDFEISGTNGAAVVVDNTNAIFATYNVANNSASIWYMDRLGTFSANVSMFKISDYVNYPNFTNYVANGYAASAVPVNSASCGEIRFARTNIIICSHQADPTTWTNPAVRDFSFVIGRDYLSGTTTRKNISLGVSNYWAADSMLWAGYGMTMDSGGKWQFNTSSSFGTNSILILRGRNGTDRVGLLDLGDFANPGKGTTTVKLQADFTGGIIDALVDKLWIGRDSTNNGTGGGRGTAELDTGRGTFDVNEVILGFQGQGNNYGTTEGYTTGTLKVSNGGLFRANGAIDLGYTTADATNNAGNNASAGFGQITVSGGAILSANLIRVGGVTKISANNTINVTGSGSKLIVSNTIAGADKALASFTLGGGATLQLSVDANNTTPYVYTTNLSVSAGAFIKIDSLVNVIYSGGVAQFPLISFQSGTPTMPGAIMPAGFVGSGSIIPNGSAEWDLYVSTNPPNTNLLWRAPAGGTGTADWDTSTKSWLDLSTGVMTNFHNGDWVTFDDTPGFATNINQAVSVLLPGQVNMSNTVLDYKFTGSGLQGGGTLTKTGTGTLQVAGTVSLPMTITQGLLTNTIAGTILGVAVSAGASLANVGTVNGNVTCGGQSYNVGVINAALTISSGGVMTNLGLIQGGAFTVQGGGFLYNGTNAILDNFGSSTVVSNATLINDGILGTEVGGFIQSLTVNGTLKDSGASGLPSMSLQTLTINQGAVFIPGGDDLGTSSIRNPLNGNTNGPPGRVVLSSGSTNIFKVNAGTLASSRLLSAYQDFGPSQSSQLQNGCTLVITNVSGTPFAAGQYFRLFGIFSTGGNPVPTGTATNSFPVIVPAKPGPGLIWDLTRLWGNNGSGNWGYIGVAVPGIVHLTNSFTLPDGTNVVGQFSWPSTNYGWRLQSLITPRTVGLVAGSNWDWTGVAGSWTNLSMTLSNKISTTNNVFYRLVFP